MTAHYRWETTLDERRRADPGIDDPARRAAARRIFFGSQVLRSKTWAEALPTGISAESSATGLTMWAPHPCGHANSACSRSHPTRSSQLCPQCTHLILYSRSTESNMRTLVSRRPGGPTWEAGRASRRMMVVWLGGAVLAPPSHAGMAIISHARPNGEIQRGRPGGTRRRCKRTQTNARVPPS